MTRAFIEITAKPRLLKRGKLWMCVGLSKNHWLRGQTMITQYGQTAAAVFEQWEHVVKRGFFK